jgi:hypothetical protein
LFVVVVGWMEKDRGEEKEIVRLENWQGFI